MYNYKVRFHLGKGVNFMKWRIENTVTKKVQFIDPKQHSLKLIDCRLRNQKSTALKIHQGANKSVCAWVDCNDFIIESPNSSYINNWQLTFNPKVAPHWQCREFKNKDNETFDELFTYSNKIYL